MSMAVNMIKKKIGETSANSTRAWLRCPLTHGFNAAPNRCANELNNRIGSTPTAIDECGVSSWLTLAPASDLLFRRKGSGYSAIGSNSAAPGGPDFS